MANVVWSLGHFFCAAVLRIPLASLYLFFCHSCTDIFSQIADPTGVMIYSQFDQFLKEVLKLPVAVFEGPSFSYTEQTARTCFAQQVGTTDMQQIHYSCGIVDNSAVPTGNLEDWCNFIDRL